MRLSWIALGVLAGLTLAAPTDARDVALLIGNAAYENEQPLQSPLNDVATIAARLEAMDYAEVIVRRDLDLNAFVDALDAFEQTAAGADTALIYFAGHGMEIEGTNYLVPVDAMLARESRARYEAVDLDVVRDVLSGAERLRVVIVDACRDNRFLGGVRGTRGFAPVADAAGEVVVFSTRPGDVAEDTVADLGVSPFAAALDEALAAEPNQDVRILFTSLAARVHELAGREQTPMAVIGQMPLGHVALRTGVGTPSETNRGQTRPTVSASEDPIDLANEVAAAAVEGGAAAVTALGDALLFGRDGRRPNAVAAARVYRQACALGDPAGCGELGELYREGQGGLTVDYAQAVGLYQTACDGGHAASCSNLGTAYANGQGGLPQDVREAVRLFGLACEGGSAGGCRNLAVAYELGYGGVSADRAEAVRLYRRALALDPAYEDVRRDLQRLGARP